jgi:uncharacterized protein YndB with AHSA1/START domain
LRRTLLMGLPLWLCAPATALAHGATPQKVVETIEIAAPPEKVWAVVGDFADANWMANVERTEAQGGVTPDVATRRRFLKRGGEIDERLVQYDAAAMSLRYIMENVDVKVLPVGNLSATLSVRANESGGSHVEWKSRFYRAFPGGNPPEQFTDEVATAAVSGQFKAGLAALKARVEAR